MPGPGPGQRRVAGLLGEHVARSTGSAAITVSHLGHSVLPTRDRDRAAHGQAVPHAAEELDLVLLELHPGAAAVAEPAPGELGARCRPW